MLKTGKTIIEIDDGYLPLWETLVKQLLIVVKLKLDTFNETLSNIDYKEKRLRGGLGQRKFYVNAVGARVGTAAHLLPLKVMLDPIAKALDAPHALQRTLDVLVGTIAGAWTGILPPRVAPPTL